jgi:PEP-CTERM motif-containing protein
MFIRHLYRMIFVIAAPAAALAAPVLYGGNGGHIGLGGQPNSINNGALVTLDQNNAAVSLVGTPSGVARLNGLAFDSSGNLFGSTITGGGFPPPSSTPLTSNLVRLNPTTGALIQNIGPITANGSPLGIAEITIQPGTGVLYGVEGPDDGLNQPGTLWKINPQTGVATQAGSTGKFFDTITFAPNGTLYLEAADFLNGPVNPTLNIIDPNTGQILSSHPTDDFFGALAVRPDNGLLFGSTGDTALLMTIDPSTGAQTLVGSTGLNYVGALAFAPVPEPTTFLLLGLGLLAGSMLVTTRKKV